MPWCCASLLHLCSERDDNQLVKKQHEVVVEKLAIKSIPLPPRDRLSSRPERSNLNCPFSRLSSKISQSTQTLLSMQHLQFLNVENSIRGTSPISSFTKLERIQEDNNEITAYHPLPQDFGILDCTMLFTRISPQEEGQYSSLILDQSSEEISNPLLCENIISQESKSLIKATSDLIQKESQLITEEVSGNTTSPKNIGPICDSSSFFPSSERLICVKDLEYQASNAEDQNLTANIKRGSPKITSTISNEHKLSQAHSMPVGKHTSQGFLAVQKNKTEYSKSTDEPYVFENVVNSSISTVGEVPRVTNIHVPCSPKRREILTSALNANIPEAYDAVISESQLKETKSWAVKSSMPTMTSETCVPRESFQQSIAIDRGLNGENSLEHNTTHSTKVLKANIQKVAEETMMSHSGKNRNTIESKKSEKCSDNMSKCTHAPLLSEYDRHPTYIHATYLKNSTTPNKPLPKLEPMPTFIGFYREESTQKKKTFTPEDLSLFLATCIKNDWLTLESKTVHCTSYKSANLGTLLETNPSASKQSTLENEVIVIGQEQQNTSNFSSNINCKRKVENHFQYFSNLVTYSDSFSKTQQYKVKRKHGGTTKTFFVEKTIGDCCPKQMTVTMGEKINGNVFLEENKDSNTIPTLNDQSADSPTMHENDKLTNSTSISAPEIPYQNSKEKIVWMPECLLQCSHDPKLSTEAPHTFSKHKKCGTGRNNSECLLDHHLLSKHHSEYSTSALDFTFLKENMNTVNTGRSSARNAFPSECNSAHLREPPINQNVLEATVNYEFPTHQHSCNNFKATCETNQNFRDVTQCKSNSSNTFHNNKMPITSDVPQMKHQFRSCVLSAQEENVEDAKMAKNASSKTAYRETRKLSNSNFTYSCTPKSEIRNIGAPSSASSSYDHYNRTLCAPASNLSQSSLHTTEELQESTMRWTIIIQHVDPQELHD